MSSPETQLTVISAGGSDTGLERPSEWGAPPARVADVAPVISIEQAIARHRLLSEYVSKVMRPGHDYGQIPGTNSKPSLLKPGAEKLTTLFGLTKRLLIIEQVEDWTGDGHGGEPFFYYVYRCALLRGDLLIAEGDGSCNSRESKYRWRESQRRCPSCQASAIIKGKAEYGGGWVCYKKKGGCGATFADSDPAITGQQIGRVANPDIADQVNTIQKMAAKRALVAATLLAVNASEFFTQDVEDFAPSDEPPPEPPRSETPYTDSLRAQLRPDPTPTDTARHEPTGATHAAYQPQPQRPAQKAEPPRLATRSQVNAIETIARERGLDAAAEADRFFGCAVRELTMAQASTLITRLQSEREVA
jgi:hypothetical protein